MKAIIKELVISDSISLILFFPVLIYCDEKVHGNYCGGY